MPRTIDEVVRSPRLARSFTAGYRPPIFGPDALLEGEPLVVFPDKVLLVGIGGGLFAEFDLGGAGPGPGPALQRYVHDQPQEAAPWFVNHNLGRRPVIAVLGPNGAQVLAAIVHVSDNQARIDLESPLTGQAVCI